ncbi:hypothetical protein [Fibrella forsythiae]|uniref:Uncharacterized protein n=1 Tax=Fibrella forsythiae TaxID=2817061 RepID=A0ABS3JJJ5_9BACT|nr:hypothetical protein [Fibrella forsythiae]MBO0950166.1 hypothetical protein [Fibrella forsythiae]
MSSKSLFNQLKLAYAPLTAYEFAVVKDDILIERSLCDASLYLLAQRPVITFENVIPDKSLYQLNFEIHQRGNPNIIKCTLPFDQEVFELNDASAVYVAFNFLNKSTEQEHPPLYNIHGFSLARHNPDRKEFIIWFSPEKLLQNWWTGSINCTIEGDWKSLTRYTVHYVGKATKQSILKRLKGHSTLQDILSLESPVTDKQLPANEIVVLPFKFQDNLQMQTFGLESDTDSMVAALKGENYPNQDTVFLDAEKALIKAMQPKYNKELFKNYPVSKDGLYDHKYNAIAYTFMDPITLIYTEGEIRGGLTAMGGDSIFILENQEFKMSKY